MQGLGAGVAAEEGAGYRQARHRPQARDELHPPGLPRELVIAEDDIGQPVRRLDFGQGGVGSGGGEHRAVPMLQQATQGFQDQGIIIHHQDQGPRQGIRPH